MHGTYVIDPALAVPPCLLAPLAPGELRTNATLITRNGGVTAEVWVYGGFARSRRRGRATGGGRRGSSGSSASTEGGELELELDDMQAGPSSEVGQFFEPGPKPGRADIEVKSENGSVSLKLVRCPSRPFPYD